MTPGLRLTNDPASEDPSLAANLCAPDAVVTPPPTSNLESTADPTADSWRVEVAARLERYRTRRKPRSPRYPSLLLPFDAPESRWRNAPSPGAGTAALA